MTKTFLIPKKWYKDWRVKIIELKSIHCTFTLGKGKCPPITLNDHTLSTAQNIRYLGIIIDQRLTWSLYSSKQTFILKRSTSVFSVLSKLPAT